MLRGSLGGRSGCGRRYGSGVGRQRCRCGYSLRSGIRFRLRGKSGFCVCGRRSSGHGLNNSDSRSGCRNRLLTCASGSKILLELLIKRRHFIHIQERCFTGNIIQTLLGSFKRHCERRAFDLGRSSICRLFATSGGKTCGKPAGNFVGRGRFGRCSNRRCGFLLESAVHRIHASSGSIYNLATHGVNGKPGSRTSSNRSGNSHGSCNTRGAHNASSGSNTRGRRTLRLRLHTHRRLRCIKALRSALLHNRLRLPSCIRGRGGSAGSSSGSTGGVNRNSKRRAKCINRRAFLVDELRSFGNNTLLIRFLRTMNHRLLISGGLRNAARHFQHNSNARRTAVRTVVQTRRFFHSERNRGQRGGQANHH